MPIRSELRHLYSDNWSEISYAVRFVRAGGRCEHCGRRHGQPVYHLADGRACDDGSGVWRGPDGQPCDWPDLIERLHMSITFVWLATAHLDNDPTNNDPDNLAALCQKCHMAHDRQYHRLQTALTLRRRKAVGDLFLGFHDPATA